MTLGLDLLVLAASHTPDLLTVALVTCRCLESAALCSPDLTAFFHRTREARRPDPPPASHSWREK